MTLNTLFCEGLPVGLATQLAKEVGHYRAGVLSAVVDTALRSGAADTELRHFVQDLASLSNESPQGMQGFARSWAPAFLLGRLRSADQLSAADRDALIGTLSSVFLIERLTEPGTTSVRRYVTPIDGRGRLRSLMRHAWIEFAEPAYATVEVTWELDPGKGEVVARTAANGNGPDPLALPLPLRASPSLSFVPFTRATRWGLPIVEGAGGLGVPGTDDNRTSTQEASGLPETLPLSRSLDGAHAILEDLWPEVIPWVKAVVPAFVDIGKPLTADVHRSSTYGPASPIFLSEVVDPLLHAEDIVHELQHERFHLLTDIRTFPRAHDPEQVFVSPYRPDPRPLRGILLGLHAFLAVNELRIRALRRRPDRYDRVVPDLLRTHRMNLFAFQTLIDFEEPGDEGRRLLAAMADALIDQHAVVEAKSDQGLSQLADRLITKHVAALPAEGRPLRNRSPRYLDWEGIATAAQHLIDA